MSEYDEEPLIDTIDLVILFILAVCSALYFARESLPFGKKQTSTGIGVKPLTDAKNGLPTRKKKNRDFVQRMKEMDKNVIIFYGSQTGTAEDYASRLAKEGTQRFGLRTMTVDVEDCDMTLLDVFPSDCIAFFCMATYGEGEPTDDAIEFWELITSENPELSTGIPVEEKPLQGLRYVVFALGNSTYEIFNAVGRTVDNKLTEFGAQRIGKRGEGDDDGSLEEDFLGWKEDMWKAVCDTMGIDQNTIHASARVPAYKITELNSYEPEKVYYGEHSEQALNGYQTYDAKNPYPAPIQISRELFKIRGRNCVHLEMDISESGMTYQSGDHCAIWPMNPEQDVYRILHVLGLWEKRDTVIMVESTDPSATKKHPFPVPTTYATIFRNYLDIHTTTSRQFIGTLAQYVSTEEARAKLTSLGEDKEAYRVEVADSHLTLGELLEKISPGGKPLDTIPLDLIIESLPRLQLRYYSISSSPKATPNSIHVTATVLSYNPSTASEKTVYGLATNYLLQVHRKLRNIQHPETAPFYLYSGPRNKYHDESNNIIRLALHVRRTNFKLPPNPKTPIVMVGPGTGVAPFRGFVIERTWMRTEGVEVGDTVLFYGCRRRHEDFLYEEEFEEYFKVLGDRGKLITAFSRELEHKVYVQHRLREHKEYIWDLLRNRGGYFYVCGDAKSMARDVNSCLIQIAQECGGMDSGNATNYVKDLRNQNKYQEDVWS